MTQSGHQAAIKVFPLGGARRPAKMIDNLENYLLRSVPNQQLAEGADLIGDEITEGAHTRSPAHVAVDEEIERQSELWYLIEQANQIRVVLYRNHRKRRDPRTRFDGKYQRRRTGAARRDTRMRSGRLHPPRGSMVDNGTVELDHVMLIDIFHRLRRASPLDIGAAGKHCPRHLGDLARHECVIMRYGRAEGDVGFAFGKIEDSIDHHELHAEPGIAAMKQVQQRRPHHSIARGLGTCHAYGTDKFGVA